MKCDKMWEMWENNGEIEHGSFYRSFSVGNYIQFKEGVSRVAKCQGYGRYISVKILETWGKVSESNKKWLKMARKWLRMAENR